MLSKKNAFSVIIRVWNAKQGHLISVLAADLIKLLNLVDVQIIVEMKVLFKREMEYVL